MMLFFNINRRIAKRITTTLSFCIFILSTGQLKAQNIQVGEVIMVSTSPLKEDVKPEALQMFIDDLSPKWNKKNKTSVYALPADRGNRKGELLLTCIAEKESDRKALGMGSPFTDKNFSSPGTSVKLSDFLSNPEAYTEYSLIGANQMKSLPLTGMLGIHYIQVKPERAKEFEKLVIEKLHPAVGQLLPDMQLLYYKAVDGENKGSYVTIFTIESVGARERFWPTGGAEQEIVRQTFNPLKDLAKELGDYLVEGSYLAPESGGAAAYWESRIWTDFVYQTKK
jgi:hypothetical protein